MQECNKKTIMMPEEEGSGFIIKKYPLTTCSNCGIKSINQPSGDSCHSCNNGIMKSSM